MNLIKIIFLTTIKERFIHRAELIKKKLKNMLESYTISIVFEIFLYFEINLKKLSNIPESGHIHLTCENIPV